MVFNQAGWCASAAERAGARSAPAGSPTGFRTASSPRSAAPRGLARLPHIRREARLGRGIRLAAIGLGRRLLLEIPQGAADGLADELRAPAAAPGRNGLQLRRDVVLFECAILLVHSEDMTRGETEETGAGAAVRRSG